MYDSVLEHIYVEFKLGRTFNVDQWIPLHESDGQAFGIDEICNCVSNFLRSKDISVNKSNIVMNTSDFHNIKNFPNQNITILFNISINPQEMNYRRATYTKNDSLNLRIIQISANGNTIDELIHQCNKAICHELIHAQESDGLMLNTNQTIQSLHGKNGYRDYVKVIQNPKITEKDIKDFFHFLYWTDFAERKAFFGTLYGELKARGNEIHDTESGYMVLKDTDSWKAYEKYGKIADMVINANGKKEEEDKFLKMYNKYSTEKIRTFNYLLKMVKNRWKKFDSAVREKTARIVYRVYCNYGSLGSTIDIDEY